MIQNLLVFVSFHLRMLLHGILTCSTKYHPAFLSIFFVFCGQYSSCEWSNLPMWLIAPCCGHLFPYIDYLSWVGNCPLWIFVFLRDGPPDLFPWHSFCLWLCSVLLCWGFHLLWTVNDTKTCYFCIIHLSLWLDSSLKLSTNVELHSVVRLLFIMTWISWLAWSALQHGSICYVNSLFSHIWSNVFF